MRAGSFSVRTAKEILRDPLTLLFGLGFPVILLLLMSAIQANIPVSLFEIERLAPGMTIFGLSFMTLFSAMLISKDRESAFLQRLYATPMTALDFILGYTLPMLVIALLQSIICFLAAAVLGLELNVQVLYALAGTLPSAVFFISLGMLFGSILHVKQVGGICGALLTNLSAWLSGIWFDLKLVGGFFEKIAAALPFYHAVELERSLYSGAYEGLLGHFLWVMGYAAVVLVLAVFLFLRQMRKA